MIRVFLAKRYLASVSKLSPEQARKAESVLRAVMEDFGHPHCHAGIGLRKLGPEEYECRLDLRLRIVLIMRAEGIQAYEVMTHDQVRAWLRGR